jgi:hypothetical protein
MGALREGRIPSPQYVRLVNGPANGRQGVDFEQWKHAVYEPCKAYRKDVCKSKDPDPPITWEFGTYTAGDPRETAASVGKHFIQKYGVSNALPPYILHYKLRFAVGLADGCVLVLW